MKTFFTSDHHFSHANIIGFCGRPFRDVEEMDREMVARWNDRVGPDDVVWHLGDFAFGRFENITAFRQKLNGTIRLVLGNHDRSAARMKTVFGERNVMKETILVRDGVKLYLRHRPEPRWAEIMTPNESSRPIDYHLHGHVHDAYARRGGAINVGVDVRDFAPVTLEELLR
jgi:calcineurin-like phosphoesterase family protein